MSCVSSSFLGEHGEGVTRQLAKGWVKYELSELGMLQILKVFNVDFVYEGIQTSNLPKEQLEL